MLTGSIFFQVFTMVSGLSLTTSPSTINIGGLTPTQELAVRCTPEAGSSTVFEIIIGKKDSNGNRKEIVEIVADSNATLEDTSLQSRITLTGSLSGSSYLEFRLKDPVCSDVESSTLYCTSSWSGGGSGEDTRNLTVVSYPEDIQMTVNPDLSVYDANPYTRVEFKCDGNIGNQNVDNTPHGWNWEWRTNDPRPGGSVTSWVPYPNGNITYETPTERSNCQYRGSTTMVRYVTKVDNYKEIRCYAVTPEYGGNNTKIIITDASVFSTEPATSTVKSGETSAASTHSLSVFLDVPWTFMLIHVLYLGVSI